MSQDLCRKTNHDEEVDDTYGSTGFCAARMSTVRFCPEEGDVEYGLATGRQDGLLG